MEWGELPPPFYDSIEPYLERQREREYRMKHNWIKHPRDKVGDYQERFLIHFPLGLMMSIPVLGWGLIWLFVYYEWSEDYWVHDFAWKDVAGAIGGYAFGTLIWITLIILWMIGVL